MNALELTVTGLTSVFAKAMGGRQVVEDQDTGEHVGWYVRLPGGWHEWHAAGRKGAVPTPEQALERIAEAVTEARALEARLAAVPEALHELWLQREEAATRLERERQRNVRREFDYRRAEEEFKAADLAFSAKERALAEAA